MSNIRDTENHATVGRYPEQRIYQVMNRNDTVLNALPNNAEQAQGNISKANRQYSCHL